MDKIAKAFKKLTPKEREQVKSLLLILQSGSAKNLDIKKLKGRDDIFRARRGDIRIIYKTNNKQVNILAIERRGDTTYNF